MIKVYGIKNCDTMKKAFTWLEQNKIEYTFHDYKKSSIEEDTLRQWMKKIPMDKLINTKGPTYRKLSDSEKVSLKDSAKAVKLMIENTSMIKRPLVVMGKEEYLLGFDAESWKKVLK